MKTISTIKLNGIDAVPVKVECEVTPGIGIHLVGLADQAVKESLLRTVTALQSYGYRIPGKKIVINLAPADLRKDGCGYDLPIALASLAESGQEELAYLDNAIVLGELGLDGSVRRVSGAVQACEAAIASGKCAIIPKANAAEVAELFGEGSPIYPVESLKEALDVLKRGEGITAWDMREEEKEDCAYIGWDNIHGQVGAKRALEIAAAGGHNLVIFGQIGGGKPMLARAMRDILPPMSQEEKMEVARIYSAAGRADRPEGRPFRAPAKELSIPSLLGGGSGDTIKPGEVSLAHNGILYARTFAEWPKGLREGLRAPAEDGKIVISRLRSKVEMPAKFQLVIGSEPCPCGWYGEDYYCECTKAQREAYLSKLSGPLMDMCDVQVWVHRDIEGCIAESDSAEVVAERVRVVRNLQVARQGMLNAELHARELDAGLSSECKELIETLFERLSLSARAYSRMLRIARTIADLAGCEEIRKEHIAEAVSFRFLDRRVI